MHKSAHTRRRYKRQSKGPQNDTNFVNNNAVSSLDRVMLVSMSNLLERLVIQGAQLAYVKQSQFSKMQGFIIDLPMFS